MTVLKEPPEGFRAEIPLGHGPGRIEDMVFCIWRYRARASLAQLDCCRDVEHATLAPEHVAGQTRSIKDRPHVLAA
jgi:hypothetical protein